MKYLFGFLFLACFSFVVPAQNIELLVVHNIPTEQPATSRESNLVSPAELQPLKLQLTDSSLLAYREKGSIFLSLGKAVHVFENIFPYRLNVENFYFQGDSIAAREQRLGIVCRIHDYFEFARKKSSKFHDDTLRLAWRVCPEGNPVHKPKREVYLTFTTIFGDTLHIQNVTDLNKVKLSVNALQNPETTIIIYALSSEQIIKNEITYYAITSEKSLRKEKRVEKNKELFETIFSVEFLPEPDRDYTLTLWYYDELLRRFPNCKDLMHMRTHYVARMKKLGFDFNF